MWHPPNSLYPFASSRNCFIPYAPEIQPVTERVADLLQPFRFQWRGRWYEVNPPFRFDGASRPWWSGWAMPAPFDPRWLAGATAHDASWAGVLVEICVKDMAAGWRDPAAQRLPIWMPPALADRMFAEMNAATGLNWLQNRLALRAVTVYHDTVGRRRYVTKQAWNRLHLDSPWDHRRCLNYETQAFQSCEDMCEGFYGPETKPGGI